MPVLHIEMLAGRTREQKQELADVLTREVSRIANCSKESIQIIFSNVEREDWAVGGHLTPQPAKNS